jgi:uncharacterized membrane protein YjgN (DUF898 family)
MYVSAQTTLKHHQRIHYFAIGGKIMSNRITPVFFAIVFMGAIATTSVFGGFALLLFLLVLSAVMIGERAFALRQR